MEAYFTRLLSGRDLRSLGHNNKVIELVTDQKSFDELFALIFHPERSVVMRAADAVEKITLKNPNYLRPHKIRLLQMLRTADHKELKWHVAQLIPRIALNKKEATEVVQILTQWARNKNESKIVRVNSLQGLFDVAQEHPDWTEGISETIALMQRENIPSIQARIRKLREMK